MYQEYAPSMYHHGLVYIDSDVHNNNNNNIIIIIIKHVMDCFSFFDTIKIINFSSCCFKKFPTFHLFRLALPLPCLPLFLLCDYDNN